MLLAEEQMVVGWLSDYGVLKWDQLVQMLYTKPAQVATKILAGLKKRNVIVQNEEGYVALDQYAKTDQRLIKAMWVMLQYIDQIEPTAHYPAAYPSSIFFLKDGIGYEVLVLSRGEEHLPRLLRPMDNTKFIIVLPDIEMAGSLALPEAPCLFATVSEAINPDVSFYEMERKDDDTWTRCLRQVYVPRGHRSTVPAARLTKLNFFVDGQAGGRLPYGIQLRPTSRETAAAR